jgi:hypothetical protein
MQTIAAKLQATIDEYLPSLQALPESKMVHKPSPVKWSKKEIVGHLIDSAQNNIRRFIVAQYEESPNIVYNQDQWVAIVHYQDTKTADIIELWYLLNKQIVTIVSNTPDKMKERKCQTESLHSIEWLAEDYIKHLLHHLHQVLDTEAVAYP